MNDKQMKNAIIGFAGAVLFMIGDCLLYGEPVRVWEKDLCI